jgi:hypothetical protein
MYCILLFIFLFYFLFFFLISPLFFFRGVKSQSTLSLVQVTFATLRYKGTGGAVYSTFPRITLMNCMFMFDDIQATYANGGLSHSGALYLWPKFPIVIQGCNFTGINQSSFGMVCVCVCMCFFRYICILCIYIFNRDIYIYRCAWI